MNAPSVHRHSLSNGLTLLIQENHAQPLVAFHAVVRTGSATEGAYLGSGVSHVVEHMLFKGTGRRPVGAVEREARSYGGTSQGYTTYDATSYELTVNREFWSQGADLLVDALFHSTFDPGEFAKEREVVLRELRLRHDDPHQIAWDSLFAQAYRIHPYRIPIIGYEPLLERLTPEDSKQYHRTHYIPNAMVIAVAGDVDRQAVVQRFEELTRDIPPGRVPLEVLPEEPPPLFPREMVEEADANLAIVAVGFPGVRLSNPDLYALDLLAKVLGGGRGSRLEHALKESGIVHSVSCWNYTPLDRGLLGFSMRLDPERVGDAERALSEQLAQVRAELVPWDQLEVEKKALLREYLAGRQTVGEQAGDLATYETLVGDPSFAYRYLQGIERVRPEDLLEVARRYLRPEWATTVKLLPRGTGLKKGMEEAGSVSERATEKVVLENGVRVLLQRDPRLSLVTFQMALLGGVRFEQEQTNGLSGLTSRMLLRGTRRLSAEEIVRRIRGLGGEVNTFSGRNSLGVTLQAISQEALAAVPLLAELTLDPVFPAEELEKEKKLALAALKAQEEDPFGWGTRRLLSTLFTEHPYRLDPAGSRQTLQKIQREHLVHFHQQILHPDRLVLCVAGDFPREPMLRQLRDFFGRFRSPADAAPALPEEPPLLRLKERIETTPRREAILLIGFPGIRINDPRLAAVDLVEALLSGGAGRLFHEVRERRGLAYTVGASSIPGLDPGAFVLYAVTDPSDLEDVRQALFEEIQRLRTAPVPGMELEEAKQGLLGNRRISRQSQGVLAAQLASDELYDMGFDFSDRYEQNVRAVTADQIQSAAKQLLDPSRCVVVIGRPEEEAHASQAQGELKEQPIVAER